MLLLDLFCGAGGAAKGYHDAGFDVIGVDKEPQPHYPYEFHRSDALTFDLRGADVVHASPPCQHYSTQTQHRHRHPDLLGPTRDHLVAWGGPYVIENVEAARAWMHDPIRLCGSAFGLNLRRHRLFESNIKLKGKQCRHQWQKPRFRSLAIDNHRAGKLATVVGVHGHINYPGEFPLRCAAMGIDWMTNDELVEAIPPAYTKYLGRQMTTLLTSCEESTALA